MERWHQNRGQETEYDWAQWIAPVQIRCAEQEGVAWKGVSRGIGSWESEVTEEEAGSQK